jgi:hypothetical protein
MNLFLVVILRQWMMNWKGFGSGGHLIYIPDRHLFEVSGKPPG